MRQQDKIVIEYDMKRQECEQDDKNQDEMLLCDVRRCDLRRYLRHRNDSKVLPVIQSMSKRCTIIMLQLLLMLLSTGEAIHNLKRSHAQHTTVLLSVRSDHSLYVCSSTLYAVVRIIRLTLDSQQSRIVQEGTQ
jgi:hypothetical protein